MSRSPTRSAETAPPIADLPVDPGSALPDLATLEGKRRWTRDDWVAYALRMLEEGGVAAVRIDDMAKRSGRTRGSFYGYFKNREELLDAMLVTFERLRVATTESTHELQRHAGAYTLTGLVDVLASRSRGELVFHANLELAVRLWARSDGRPRQALQRLDDFRLRNACAMVRQEMPAIGPAEDIAVLFNALLQGRQLLQIDPASRALAQATERMFSSFVALCRDAASQRASGSAPGGPAKHSARAPRRRRPPD